jgi:hypothetical protein
MQPGWHLLLADSLLRLLWYLLRLWGLLLFWKWQLLLHMLVLLLLHRAGAWLLSMLLGLERLLQLV